MSAVAMQEQYSPTPSLAGRVLIADDQRHILDALQLLLKGCGFYTEAVTRPAEVLTALEAGEFDAVLMDLNYARDTTSGIEGLDLVSQIRSIDKLVPIVVMTAWGSMDLAIDAMRRGASDFVQKPWDNRQLLQELQSQVSRAREQQRAQRRREDERREAREIQQKLLPKKLPEIAGYEVAAMTQPMLFVGGDYYNVVRISRQETVICIADVAGKGMPAALLMSSLQAALKPLIWQRLPPRELCCRLNRILCDLTPLGKFISFFYAVLNSDDNRITYCNAGHNSPLLIQADGGTTELNAAGAVLGQFPNWQYEQSDVAMRSGDKLIVFTDGLVEACNSDQEPFGEQNVVRIARENHNSTAQELMRLLIDGVSRYAASGRAASGHSTGDLQDDASLIVLKAI